MPVSGRRHQKLQADFHQLLKDNAQLLAELREVVAERDAARDVVRGLSDRNRALIARPLNQGEAVLARMLRESESARALLAEQIDLLQTANEGAAREAYDAAKAARQVAA
ncbi:hypothetical protein [Streptomyces sp. NPDC059949]|uniref:hypothetical protein n=1 Tax=Streptomyces sp. NPDC059949 TaxID=3347013 RepID=UPI00364F3881